MFGTFINDDESITVLLYEDLRMGNNPFRSIINFPVDVQFHFEKLFIDKNLVYNSWEIRIPVKEIINMSEKYDDEKYWHEYQINLRRDVKIIIKGKLGWFSEDGTLQTMDITEATDNMFISKKDVFNDVEIISNIPYSEYKIIYYQKEIERFEWYLEIPEQAKHREKNLKRIEELKKILANLIL